MFISVAHPEFLKVTDLQTHQSYLGGAQEWYASEWGRKAGCGPTCAANLTAYLALTRPTLRALYHGKDTDRMEFLRHMEKIFPFVAPGPMGLNRVELFSEGVVAFAASRNILLIPHVFAVSGNRNPDRPPVSALMEFVRAGLAADCPLGFLNLSRGREKNLQDWHWISIISADFETDQLTARASDEGVLREFDLRLWYLSTRMNGGLAYFTQ
ncbi:hypothetical protein OBV_44010 [Oscillibacter valericigenes Sjm18-20]|nr:hypothetical protein OBV_44010 [Oscillibacter valericigenes Sjm18-20]